MKAYCDAYIDGHATGREYKSREDALMERRARLQEQEQFAEQSHERDDV